MKKKLFLLVVIAIMVGFVGIKAAVYKAAPPALPDRQYTPELIKGIDHSALQIANQESPYKMLPIVQLTTVESAYATTPGSTAPQNTTTNHYETLPGEATTTTKVAKPATKSLFQKLKDFLGIKPKPSIAETLKNTPIQETQTPATTLTNKQAEQAPAKDLKRKNAMTSAQAKAAQAKANSITHEITKATLEQQNIAKQQATAQQSLAQAKEAGTRAFSMDGAHAVPYDATPVTTTQPRTITVTEVTTNADGIFATPEKFTATSIESKPLKDLSFTEKSAAPANSTGVQATVIAAQKRAAQVAAARAAITTADQLKILNRLESTKPSHASIVK